MNFVELSKNQCKHIQDELEKYDEDHVSYCLNCSVTIGIEDNGRLIAGLLAYASTYKILYVDTVFVARDYRRRGYGKALVTEMERRAKQMGVNMIRLDTFDWQGKDFYLAMGYDQVGFYRNDKDDFEEYFFLKRIY